MELIISQLNKLGLATNEAKAYIALLPLQDAKASQIAAAARIPRSKIYEIMQSLHKKGFVEILPENVTRFKAVNFETAIQFYLDSWKQKMENIEKTKEKVSEYLKSVSTSSYKEEIGEFTIVKTKRIIYKKLESLLGTAASSAYLMINVSDLRRLYYVAREASKRIPVQVLVPINKENRNMIKQWMRFADVRHYETQTQVKIAIPDDDEVLIFQTNTPIALHTKDRQFTGLLKGFFNSAWESSPHGKDKIAEIETGKPVEEVRTIRGRQEIYSVIHELLDKSQKEVLINTTAAGVARIYRYFRKKLEAVRKRGVRIRCMAPITKNNFEMARQLGVEIHHIDRAQTIMSCFDDAYLMLTHIKNDAVSAEAPEDYSIVTNHQSTVDTIRQMFENMWSNSISLEARIHELETGKPVEKVEILRGNEVIYEATKELSRKARQEICTVSTEFSPERAIRFGTADVDRDVARKGAKIKYVFPITKKNIELIKGLMEFAEVRHIDFSPIRARIIDDKTCLVRYGGEEFTPLSEQVGIRSSASNYVTTMKFYFNHIWEEAIPAEERIRELETGAPIEKTEVIKGAENVYDNIIDVMRSCKKDLLVSVTEYGMNMALTKRRRLLEDLSSRGVKVRYIIPITNANLEHAKNLAKFVELRHFEVPIRLIATDSECLLTSKADKDDPKELIRSNVSGMVAKMRELLENIWSISVPAEERIRQLSGESLADSGRALEIAATAQKYLWISTTSAGLKRFLAPLARLNGREIKILCPVTALNMDAVRQAMKFAEVRHSEPSLMATIVDDRESIIVTENQQDSIYSNDNAFVASVKGFFSSLWDNATDARIAIEKIANSR